MSGRLGDLVTWRLGDLATWRLGDLASVGVWRKDDGRGGEYVIHLDGLLTESAWVFVGVCECLRVSVGVYE